MEVKIKAPPGAPTWGVGTYYEMNVIEVKTDLVASINEHPISDKDTFLFAQHLHPTSDIVIDGILTEDSSFPGSTLEAKKDNFIDAAATWWTYGDPKVEADCAKLYYRGWEQYIMIERLEIEKVAGDEIEYVYLLDCVVHDHDGAL